MLNQQRTRFAALRILAALLLFVTNFGATGTPRVAAVSSCDPFTNFNRNNFSNPTKIDNRWLPLAPGTQFTLEGRADRGGGSLPHRVVFTITDLTKVINGVRAVVVWDRDINEGQLVEA